MGFSVIRNRIVITRGDSATITITIKDKTTGELFVPGPDDELTFSVKTSVNDTEVLLRKTLGNGIERGTESCTLYLTPEDTAALSYRTYTYDVELVLASGYTDTVIPPNPFVVTGEVTTHG